MEAYKDESPVKALSTKKWLKKRYLNQASSKYLRTEEDVNAEKEVDKAFKRISNG